jgi:anti-sigma factor RsiW
VNCNEAQAIMDGYVDQELDLVSSLEMERHLETCAACSQAYENRQTLQAAIRGGSLYHEMPAHLQQRVLAAVRQTDQADASHRPETSPRALPAFRLQWRPLAAAAAFIVVGFLGWSLGHISIGPKQDDQLAQEVFAGDVRSLMAANQGIEVRSSNQHTVKPWFAGKLDFSPPVQDFGAQGYPLIGGRRDYLDGRTVAVLVYKRHAHWINLFIWPSAGPDETNTQTRQGYHLIHWSKDGMTYWAVSDVNTLELDAFVRLVQSEG